MKSHDIASSKRTSTREIPPKVKSLRGFPGMFFMMMAYIYFVMIMLVNWYNWFVYL